MSKLSVYNIGKDGEYAKFFVEEKESIVDNKTIYEATFVAYSSFGVYGHSWTSMGVPFKEFISKVRPDYLLGKIATKEFSEIESEESLRREIEDNKKSNLISEEEYENAINQIDYICKYYSGENQAIKCYEDEYISRALCDVWDNITTQDYPQQAYVFVEKLWPLFIQQIK